MQEWWISTLVSAYGITIQRALYYLFRDHKGNFDGKLNACIHVCMCVAPLIVRGAWPMAVMLWRLFEYYCTNSIPDYTKVLIATVAIYGWE